MPYMATYFMIMKKTLLTLVCTFLVFASCSQKKELTVIEGLNLGVQDSIFQKQLSKLNLENSNFLTTSYVLKQDDYLQNVGERRYYTSMFNNPKYKNSQVEHLGILYPKESIGSSIVTELIVLLGHTEDVIVNTNNGEENYTKTKYLFPKAFEQVVRKEILDDIEKLLTQKYGTYKKIKIDDQNFPEYLLQGKQVVEKNNLFYPEQEALIWETDNIEITFYRGGKADLYMINTVNNNYLRTLTTEVGSNTETVFVQPYISYKLNDKAKKSLNLDNSKI